MQYEVDSYTLEFNEDENKYYISFKDSVDIDCKFEISKEIYEAYIESKSKLKKSQNEEERHWTKYELTEKQIYNSVTRTEDSVEEIIIKNIQIEEIRKAKKELTEIQIKRIELHIEEKIGITELARRENVRRKQIDKSIERGIKKIKKFLKNRGAI